MPLVGGQSRRESVILRGKQKLVIIEISNPNRRVPILLEAVRWRK
jgi:hypothetical protein